MALGCWLPEPVRNSARRRPATIDQIKAHTALALIDAQRCDLHRLPVGDLGMRKDPERLRSAIQHDGGAGHLPADRSPVHVSLPPPTPSTQSSGHLAVLPP